MTIRNLSSRLSSQHSNKAKVLHKESILELVSSFETESSCGKFCLWVCGLPEQISSAAIPPELNLTEYDSAVFPEVSIYGDLLKPGQLFDKQQPVAILSLNDRFFFQQVLIPLTHTGPENRPINLASISNRISIANQFDCALLVWVQLDLITALEALGCNNFQSSDNLNSDPPRRRRFLGNCASLLLLRQSAIGLWTMLDLESSATGPTLAIAADDKHSPFPGLEKLLSGGVSAIGYDSPQSLLAELRLRKEKDDRDEKKQLKIALLGGDCSAISKILNQNRAAFSHRANWQFAAAEALAAHGEHHQAARCFHRAQQLGHFAAVDREIAMHRALAEPLRQNFPEVFEQIRRGERLRALTTLRAVCQDYPLAANAILSYCLRETAMSDEGLIACKNTLEIEQNQSDVWQNKWSFELELNSPELCLASASEHIFRYPQDLTAITNLLDSYLQINDATNARISADRYFIQSQSLPRSLKTVFRAYEASGDWLGICTLFDKALPLISGPTADLLACYGEVLIEVERFDDCFSIFERALEIEPGNSRVIIGYARSLARADREEQAERFLATVLADPNRIDRLADRALLVTLRAEIKRRTGYPEQALELIQAEFGSSDLVELSVQVGPQPGLEFAEILIALNCLDTAIATIRGLYQHWPNELYVADLYHAVVPTD